MELSHFSALIIFLSAALSSAAPAPAPAPTPPPPTPKLIQDVCRNTSNYQFCVKTFLSDPFPLTDPSEQPKVLAEIAFGWAGGYASTTSEYIEHLPKSVSAKWADELDECDGAYVSVADTLLDFMGDMGEGEFSGVGPLAKSVSDAASSCDKVSKGRKDFPVYAMNRHMMLLGEMCLAVSKLFPY